MPAEELLELIALGIVLTDEDGNVRYLNNAACELLAVRREAALGMPALAVLRDHRLEEALTSRSETEVLTRQRHLQARGIAGGLLLTDVSEARNAREDRKSTRLNSSHVAISYAVFCL